MELKPYPKYKDSGIQWIEEIPEGWEVRKVKHLCFKSAEYGLNEPSDNYVDDGVRFLRITDITENGNLIENGIYLPENKTNKEYLLNTGDVLVARSGSIGTSLYFDKEKYGKCLFAGYLVRFVVNKTNSGRFLYYFTNSKSFYAQIELETIQTTIGNFNGQKYANMRIAIPPLPEQTTIANFLDKQTAKIDVLIEKDKKLIELLKEKRTALINHAVTKGLDPNVKLKDSGIQWIGKIPEGREVNKIKNTSYVKGRIGWHGLTSEEYSDEGAYLVTGTDFKDGVIEWDDCHHVGWDRYKEDPYIHLKEDDLLITKDGTIGKVALIKILPNKATLNSGIFLVRPLNKKYIPKFMYWVLNSAVFERFFDYIKTGATISHLYQETFERFFFPIPKKQEQQKIVEYLGKATSKIDKTIKLIEQKINLIEEYKKSLIHHVVTGKVDVREAVA